MKTKKPKALCLEDENVHLATKFLVECRLPTILRTLYGVGMGVGKGG